MSHFSSHLGPKMSTAALIASLLNFLTIASLMWLSFCYL